MLVKLRTEEISGPSGVREQMMDGGLGGEVLVRVIGEVLPERVGELNLAGLRELKNGDSGEHLVHRADAESRVELVGNFLFAVG